MQLVRHHDKVAKLFGHLLEHLKKVEPELDVVAQHRVAAVNVRARELEVVARELEVVHREPTLEAKSCACSVSPPPADMAVASCRSSTEHTSWP